MSIFPLFGCTSGERKKGGKSGIGLAIYIADLCNFIGTLDYLETLYKKEKKRKNIISLLAMSTADLKLVIYIFYLSFDFLTI